MGPWGGGGGVKDVLRLFLSVKKVFFTMREIIGRAHNCRNASMCPVIRINWVSMVEGGGKGGRVIKKKNM